MEQGKPELPYTIIAPGQNPGTPINTEPGPALTGRMPEASQTLSPEQVGDEVQETVAPEAGATGLSGAGVEHPDSENPFAVRDRGGSPVLGQRPSKNS